MTPLHLEILRHYVVSGTENDYWSIRDRNEIAIIYAYQLAKKGLLFTAKESKCLFEVTEYGKTIFEKIIAYSEDLIFPDGKPVLDV